MRAINFAILGCLALLVACASMQSSSPDIRTLSGAQTYETFCASCHGAGAEGDGPVAPLIKVPVPDLTRIAQRAGGEFPTEDVRRTIDGRWDRSAHGARDMPVWGWDFVNGFNIDESSERRKVDAIIDKLIVYLQSIQKN
jgi:mono/diheme cytochrome c family protein